MKTEHSGEIYRFDLLFGKGCAFAELLDYSDVLAFDGILIQVYNLVVEKNTSICIDEIISSGVLFGPAPIHKYPNTRGRGAWTLIGRNEKYSKNPPFTKDLGGKINTNDWANLKPWFKEYRFDRKSRGTECDYEDIRGLETMILNHVQTIKDKITMMIIIKEGGNVSDYYDLRELGNHNIYLQLVNTYYSKEQANKLLSHCII